jgi:L-fuculose-phosphate aldolase
MSVDSLKEHVATAAKRLHADGLLPGKSGNVSVLCLENELQEMVITPTAKEYGKLQAADCVVVNLDGGFHGPNKPSSEWKMHRRLYRDRLDALAVVHTHSPWATAFSCSRRVLPFFHYEMGLFGGPVPCAPYELFGTEEFANRAAEALGNGPACFLANHGAVTVSDSLERAMELAYALERMCEMFQRTHLFGGDIHTYLTVEQGEAVVRQFKAYREGRLK